MQKPKARWNLVEQSSKEIDELVTALQIEPIVARLLVNRGFDTVDKAKRFLFKEHMEYYDPFLLHGMDRAVSRIQDAIQYEENILIFGDYDADGVSSVALLYSVFQSMGAKVNYYIPNRFTEGYGPNERAIRQASDEGYNVIITVDTGISAIDEVAVANELGIDFIITDHHEPPATLPEAYAIINPKQQNCTYPFKELAGVGLAFKMAHALSGNVPSDWVDIAAIGTIADLVPLVDENRLIAIDGLDALHVTEKQGLIALKEVCSLQGKEIRADHIGFGLGPRLNAAGRLGSANPAVELLLSTDQTSSKELALEIDALNRERQQLVTQLTEEAITYIEQSENEQDVIVVAKENWHVGVIGIVASRLVERYYRPTIVLSIDPETGLATGSARSIDGFHLYEELSKNDDLLLHYGGHPMAAGLTMKQENINELQARLHVQIHTSLTAEQFQPCTTIDLTVPLEHVSLSVIQQLEQLAPFGMHNDAPKVMIEDARLQELRRIGRDESHLKVVFNQNGASLDAVGFQLGYLAEEITPQATVCAVGSLSINEWNGHVKPQLIIEDMGVFEWQLFDWRSMKRDQIAKRLQQLPEEKRVIISFRTETKEKLGLQSHPIIHIEQVNEISLQDKYVVLLDVPKNNEDLNELFTAEGKPSRIYTIFYQETNSFFTTVPNREQFKWFYQFLVQRKTFETAHNKKLEKHKGWSQETVQFMTDVFLELHFVTIENGIIHIVENPQKASLTMSKTFQKKQEQVQIENDYVYSSYNELKSKMNQLMEEKDNKMIEQMTSKGTV